MDFVPDESAIKTNEVKVVDKETLRRSLSLALKIVYVADSTDIWRSAIVFFFKKKSDKK